MDDIISAIIKIEDQADEVYYEAKNIENISNERYEKAIFVIRKKSSERIEIAKSKKEEECKRQFDENIIEIRKRTSKKLQKMSEEFEENKKDYIQKLFEKVLAL